MGVQGGLVLPAGQGPDVGTGIESSAVSFHPCRHDDIGHRILGCANSLWVSETMWQEISENLEFEEEVVVGHVCVAKKGLLIRLIFIEIFKLLGNCRCTRGCS